MATLFYTSCAEVFSILALACVIVVYAAQRQFSPIAKRAVGYLLDELIGSANVCNSLVNQTCFTNSTVTRDKN